MTANALAKELGLPIAYVRLDGLVSSYLGQTGTNVRKIFEYAKGKRIMLFLDEFDAIAKKRDDTQDLGELKRVVTTLLQNLDSMQTQTFLVAATNHHHLLDPAIWRRFDITILLELPNVEQREQIVTHASSTYLRSYTIVDRQKLVLLTEGMSGAQMQSFLQSLGKYCVMNKQQGDEVDIEEIGKIWLQHTALYVSEESDAYLTALLKLQKHGVPLRTLAAITGIPKSTLAYRINKEEKTHE
jgi:SpoVK/Ycf46/Vps4 family AAA+-type ATPase